MSDWLACDWGTTNVRAWRMRDGEILATASFPFGVARLDGETVGGLFETRVRPALEAEGLPALICGMAGSNLGWMATAYVDCPAGLQGIAEALARPAPDAWIAPGVRRLGERGPDVMRGEETQLLGWQAAGGRDGIGCLPGTHSKWVRMRDGRIADFVSFMSGELFGLLRDQGVLATRADAADPEGFRAGLAAAGDGGALASRLFAARARRLTGETPPEQEAGFLSGLIIGAEVAAAPGLIGADAGETITLIGEPGLCQAYRAALAAAGWPAETVDGDAAAVAGLAAIRERMPR